MKKAVILLAGLLTVLSMSFASAQFSDVPAGHWAKEAVEALAAQGIILGFPDGTFRGNENLTRYQAAMIIYRLLQKLQPNQVAQMDQETLTALRNAVQELAAELASLGVRVSALEDNAATKDDVARLEKMIADLKAAAPAGGGDTAAIKDLADRVEAAAIAADTAMAQVQALQGKVDTLSSQVAANSDSIKALNELSVMLNQDVLSLQDRVTALEKASMGAGKVDMAGIATKGDVQSVRDYVTAIRGDLVNVANKVSALEANVSDLQDRVGGLERNAFSISGGLTLKYKSVRFNGAAFDIDRLYSTAFSTGGKKPVAKTDFESNVIGETDAGLNVTFQTGKFTGTSKGEGVNTYADFFQFSIKGSWDAAAIDADPANASSFNLVVDQVSTTVDIAKGQKLYFTFGRSVETKFTEYLFDNDANSYGHGFVAVFKPGFLGTEIKAVYGNHAPGTAYQYFYGVHVAIAPFNGFTVGGSYLRQDMAGSPFWGVDMNIALGGLNASGEYFTDNAGIASYYIQGSYKLTFGDNCAKIGANYRNIGAISAASTMSGDADFTNGSDDNSAPFRADSSGFGVNGKVKFGIVTATAYYDNFTSAGTPIQAYGADLGVKLAGMQLSAFYKSHNGTTDSVDGAAPGATYDAVYGATLDHPAEGAIIPGLHFYAGYKQFPKSSATDIEVYADYNGKFSIASVQLLGRYHSLTGADTTIKYGIKLETDPMGIFLKPSIKAGYVARTTGTVSETYWFAGLKFNEFLCAHSVFEGAYASYSGAGLADMLVGSDDAAFNAAKDYIYQSGTGAAAGTFSGYYLSWTYWDLQFAYANFGDGTNSAEAFQIKYAINF
ncbi:S-layer homology domain-containing protein [Oceanithermus sp.]